MPTVRSCKSSGQHTLGFRGIHVVIKAQTLFIYLLHSRCAFCIGIKSEDNQTIAERSYYLVV